MQQISQHRVRVGILLGVLGLSLVFALIGCSNEPEPFTLDPCDRPGWHDCEEPPPVLEAGFFAPDDGMGGIQNGIRFSLNYDPTANAFTGYVENITGNTLASVTVEVRLYGSDDRDTQVTLVDLAPSQVSEVTLPVGSDPFTIWSGHLTIR